MVGVETYGSEHFSLISILALEVKNAWDNF